MGEGCPEEPSESPLAAFRWEGGTERCALDPPLLSGSFYELSSSHLPPLWSAPHPVGDFDVAAHAYFAGSCHRYLQKDLPIWQSLNQGSHFLHRCVGISALCVFLLCDKLNDVSRGKYRGLWAWLYCFKCYPGVISVMVSLRSCR